MNPPNLSACYRYHIVLRAVFMFVVGLVMIGCDRSPTGYALEQFRGVSMGTTYTVKLVELPRDLQVTAVHNDIDLVLQEVNQRMSTYLDDSELSLFNHSAETSWIDASEELVDLLSQALRVSKLTDGAFDVTVGPLVNVWGFGPSTETEQVPTELAIQSALARVGYLNLHVRRFPPGIKKDRPDIYVDLSAIAKGYAVDLVAARLESKNIQNYMVEIGGEVRARGHNAKGTPWRIAIEQPSVGERVVYNIIDLQNLGLATSGDYRNYFEKDGQRYSHTIDPKSGRPIKHKLASVTVANPSAMRADAFATALLVLGPEVGYRLAEEIDLAAFFIIKTDAGFTHKATTAFALIPSTVPR